MPFNIGETAYDEMKIRFAIVLTVIIGHISKRHITSDLQCSVLTHVKGDSFQRWHIVIAFRNDRDKG
jgi:hypothetical protein